MNVSVYEFLLMGKIIKIVNVNEGKKKKKNFIKYGNNILRDKQI